ncbi:MAG TPA: hypothetical protein VHF22_04640 [Planctomycetota bacterium]|nr:hypothetical protein [Planctomycetota bacterium]
MSTKRETGWHAYEDGVTLGKEGSERGVIRLDLEHSAGVRITVEEAGYQPWSITCGVYGCMVHTIFFREREEAFVAAEKIKRELLKIARLQERVGSRPDPDWSEVGEACRKFVDRW